MEANVDAFDADLSDVDMPGLDAPEADPAPEAPAAVEAAAPVVEGDPPAPSDQAKAAAVQAVVAQTTPKAPATAAKPLTFTVDGKPVALNDTAETEWKVDGKSEKVKLKDLLDNYAGKVAYDKRFQELSEQKKGFHTESSRFQQDRERHKALITDMHKATSEGRVFDAVANMLEMTGLDKKMNVDQYVSELRNALIKQADEFRGLSPEQRQLRELREKQEHLQSKHDRFTQARSAEQAQLAFHTRVDKAIESVKSNPEEFVNTRNFLVGQYQERKWDPRTITPERVAEQIRDVRDYKTVKEAMEAVDPTLTKNESLWEQTVHLMRANPTWTSEDIKEIFQKAIGAKRSSAVSAKLAKSPTSTVAKAATKGKAAAKSDPDDYSKFTADDLSW